MAGRIQVALAGAAAIVFASASAPAALVQLVRLDDTSATTAVAEVGPNATYESFVASDLGRPKATPLSGGTAVSFPNETGAAPYHRINLGDSAGVLGGLTAATVSMWVKSDDNSSDHTYLSISNFAQDSDSTIFWRDDDAGTAGSNVLAVLVASNRTTGGTINDTNWHHVAFTYQASTPEGLKLYLDGTKVGVSDTTTSAIPFSGTDPLTAGNASNPSSSTKDMIGSMDEIAIYNSALTDAQIAMLASGVDPTLVPEPSSLLLMGMVGGGLLLRRGRGSCRPTV